MVGHLGYPTPQDIPPENDTRPPLFERYAAYEESLPQHSESLPYPDDSSRKFVSFANHVWGVGWGNAMQEMVLNAQLAYESGRTFVFDDYTWSRETNYSEYNTKLIPSRIPISALLSGPIAGQSYSDSAIAQTHPRAVSRRYFEQICPEPYILEPRALLEALGNNSSAVEIMSVFVKQLQSITDRCVEIQKDTTQVFDYMLLGSARLHDIVPSLINSPIMRDFSWSPLIHHAFRKNEHHFTNSPKSLISILFPYLASNDSSAIYASDSEMTPTPPASETQSLPVLALHLRRGDFIEHCDKLSGWGSMYTGYNTQPSLPDRFFMENATLRDSMSAEEKQNAYRQKCLIDIDEVRKRVVRAVKEWRSDRLRIERERSGHWLFAWWRMRGAEARIKGMLRKVYVMTNGDHEFLAELKSALIADAERSVLRSSNKFKAEDTYAQSTITTLPSSLGEEYDFDFTWSWDEVSTSRDLDIGWEAKYVAQGMDMYIGQRAEVFIGNGFSSLTGNVVFLRSVAGVESWRTRFW